LATTIFEISVLILAVSLNDNLSLQKIRMPFSLYEVTMCFLLYNLLFQASQFAFFMEHLKIRKYKMSEFLSNDHTGFQQVFI